MTDGRTIERVLDTWLGDGPTEVPDRVLDAALDEIERTDQRRRFGGALRGWTMTETFKTLVAAAAVLALVIGGSLAARIASTPSEGATGASAPPAAATPAPAAPAVTMERFTSALLFTSALFGYSVEYPSSWRVRDPLADVVTFEVPRVGPVFQVYVTPARPTIASGAFWWPWGGTWPIAGSNADELAASAVADLARDGIEVVSNEPATLDGQPARRLEISGIEYEVGTVAPVTVFLAHHGDLAQAIIHYGPHGAPEIETFIRSFTFTDEGRSPDSGG
jgi:hypothetical protein